MKNSFYTDTTTNLAGHHYNALNAFLGENLTRQDHTFLTTFEVTRTFYTAFYASYKTKFHENYVTVHKPDVLNRYEFANALANFCCETEDRSSPETRQAIFDMVEECYEKLFFINCLL